MRKKRKRRSQFKRIINFNHRVTTEKQMSDTVIYPSISAVLAATERAVLPGRGARNQRYWFHQLYLDEKDELQRQFRYKTMKRHGEKRFVQMQLIAWVEDQGGAFYKRNPNGTYQRMSLREKLRKVSTSLRETRKRSPVDIALLDTFNLDLAFLDTFDHDFQLQDLS